MACILITICWYILRALCSEVKFPLEGKTHRPAFFFVFNVYFNYMYRNFIYTPHVCLPEEGVKTFGTGVTDGCEPWYGFWGLNLGSLQEQQVLLSPEPSLQPQVWLSWGKIFFKKGVGSQFLSMHKPSFLSPYFTYLLYIPIEAPTLLTQPPPLSFEKGEVPLGHCPILAKEYTWKPSLRRLKSLLQDWRAATSATLWSTSSGNRKSWQNFCSWMWSLSEILRAMGI